MKLHVTKLADGTQGTGTEVKMIWLHEENPDSECLSLATADLEGSNLSHEDFERQDAIQKFLDKADTKTMDRSELIMLFIDCMRSVD